MSWAIARDVEAGNYLKYKRDAQANYTYQMCSEPVNTVVKQKFGLGDLGGPMLLLFTASALSLFITRIGRRIDRRVAKTKDALDADHDNHITTAELAAGLDRMSQNLRSLQRISARV